MAPPHGSNIRTHTPYQFVVSCVAKEQRLIKQPFATLRHSLLVLPEAVKQARPGRAMLTCWRKLYFSPQQYIFSNFGKRLR